MWKLTLIALLQSAMIVTGDNQLSDGPLVQPGEFSSNSANGNIDVELRVCNHTTVAATSFRTRCFNGFLPGKTHRVKAGDYLRVSYLNGLEAQADVNTEDNTFAHPDETNLHFHGPHISGVAPGDDTTIIIPPGLSFAWEYEVLIPADHVPGIHWIHPHRHGSGTSQIGGGAAMALIIEDDNEILPPEVETAEEVIMVVQFFKKSTLDEVAETSNDGVWDLQLAPDGGPELEGGFCLVNGQYKPVQTIQAGQWQRWRIVYANWDQTDVNLFIAEPSSHQCEINLLAKDGIYIEDYPRTLVEITTPSGGRADVMIRCNTPGNFNVFDRTGNVIMTLSVTGSSLPSLDPPTTGFAFPRPASYLKDLTNTPPTPGCACTTSMDDNAMNGLKYDPDILLHTATLGSVIERTIEGMRKHPYHQHVFPYQITDFTSTNAVDNAYYKIGDYADTVKFGGTDTMTIRYQPMKYPGVMAVHCHRLTHSDKGMLSLEAVVDPLFGGQCLCSPSDGTAIGIPNTDAPTEMFTSPTTPEVNCNDDPNAVFKNINKPKPKGCNWIFKKPDKRCKRKAKNDPRDKAFTLCPSQCSPLCPGYYQNSN